MDQAGQRTNTLVLPDFIEFLVKPARRKPAFFRDLYLIEGLSAAQIAERVGLSKTAVLERLRAQGVRNLPDRKASPNNYRLHEPPYGYSKIDGRLLVNRAELKVCRLVVELRERHKRSYKDIGVALELKGYKGRTEKRNWSHSTVARIYKRWKGKL